MHTALGVRRQILVQATFYCTSVTAFIRWASPSPVETKQEEKSRPCVHHKRTAKPDLIGKHICYPRRFILHRNTENIFTHLISCESQNGTKEAVMLKSAVKTPSTLSSCRVCKLTRG